MLVKTDAIILKAIKYGDTSLILHLLTKDKGSVNCIVSGVSKQKGSKSAYFLPLTVLEVVYYFKPNNEIYRLKEFKLIQSSYLDDKTFVKSSILIFINQLLVSTITHSEENEKVFDFIYHSIQNIYYLPDSKLINFPAFFFYQYTKYLGFQPLNNYSIDNKYFDVTEGVFVSWDSLYNQEGICFEEEHLFIHLVKGASIEEISLIITSNKERRETMLQLTDLFAYHIANFNLDNLVITLKNLFDL